MLLPAVLMAQATKAEKKAARDHEAAIRLEAAKKKEAAYKKMLRAIKNDPTSPDAYSVLGRWYFEAHRFDEAAEVFRNASARCKNGPRRFAKALAKSLLYSYHPDEALGIINSQPAITKDSAEWNGMRTQALFMRQAIIRAWPDQPQNLGVRVNTSYPELFPSLSADTQTLYFTRRVNDMDEDLYYANADSCGGWFSALNMGDLPNTLNQESAQCISTDGHYMFFCRCENRSEDGYAEGGCDLFMSYRVRSDTDWTIAQAFGPTINTTSYEGMPSISPDNTALYFVSDRPGGYGGYDIWISRFEDGLWQWPVNAGPSINTPGNETTPFIAADDRTLFFASDRWPGMGGADLFISHRINDTTWELAGNLGYPINTVFDEKTPYATTTGSELYFASDRNGPVGNFDLYETPMPVSLQPIAVSYLGGYVYDSLTQDRLNSAAIYICDSVTRDTLYQFRSNRGDGSFLITLPVGKTYIMHTGRVGYTDVDDTVTYGKEYLNTTKQQNVVMLPADYNPIKPINDSMIALIHFDVNRIELSDSDKAILNNAISPWLEEKGIVIYVNAYTDNTGTPMINEGLSYKRASIVAKEVISIGMDETMVQAKGWGEAKMIAPNDTEEGQRQNRRVEIIVRR